MAQGALVHTVAHHWPATGESDEGFLCVCGEFLVNEGEATGWDPPIILLSKHLKKMNVESNARPILSEEEWDQEARDLRECGWMGCGHPQCTDRCVGVKGDKPEKPEGDDPRAGYEMKDGNQNLPRSYYMLTSAVAVLFIFMMLYSSFK